MLRVSRLGVITGVVALVVAVLGLTAAVMGPAIADPTPPGPVQKDVSTNGLKIPHLGL